MNLYIIKTDYSYDKPMQLAIVADSADIACRLFARKYSNRNIKELRLEAKEIIIQDMDIAIKSEQLSSEYKK